MTRVCRPTDPEVAAGPGDRLQVLVALVGGDAVADWCAALVRGADPTDPAAPDLDWLGGASSRARRAKDLDLDYWPRVWGARGLLHGFRPQGAQVVVAGLDDAQWRVREMCAKVVREHEVGAAAPRTPMSRPRPVGRSPSWRAVSTATSEQGAADLVRGQTHGPAAEPRSSCADRRAASRERGVLTGP